MGAVYKARQVSLDRLVSLKVLSPGLSRDHEFITRFKHEAIAAARLNHPNLVQVYSAGESEGSFYLSMEFIEGDSLQKKLERAGRLDVEQSLATCYYLAHALDHAWQKGGLIHRGIKPSNIYLSRHGEVKLGDLGVARPASAAFAGDSDKPYYISPEQARGEPGSDPRSDTYSLGCVLYHVLTGQPPYDAATTKAVVFKHINDPPPMATKAWPACPAPVALLLNKMLAKDPAERHQNYTELIADLVRASEQLGLAPAGSAQRVAPKTTPPLKPATARTAVSASRKSPASILLAAGVIVIAAAAAMIWAPWKEQAAPAVKLEALKTESSQPAIGEETKTPGEVPRNETEPPKPAPATAPAQPQTPPPLPPASMPLIASAPPAAAGSSAPAAPAAADTAWIASVAPLPAEEQLQRVTARLKELNPGYDGGERHRITDGQVTALTLLSGAIKDLSPVRALTGLRELVCGSSQTEGTLADVSPLRGMPLTILRCINTKIADLSPLRGMPLAKLALVSNPVSDLSPVKDAPLTQLYLGSTLVSDLAPLRGMQLINLYLEDTAVTDLSPLENMPLTQLSLRGTRVTDLKPIQNMPLTFLEITDSTVTDLSPLATLPLKQLRCDPAVIQNKSAAQILLGIATLNKINNLSVATALQQAATATASPAMETPQTPPVLDAFSASVAALPAERQIAAVVAKLRELNPRFDGREQHRIARGVVTDLNISTAAITDLSPVRALAGLQRLTLAPWSGTARGALADLSPLKGLQLSGLWCHNTQVAGLSPLHDMPLTTLTCDNTAVRDLSPLRGMKLAVFGCSFTAVDDLSPLDGMPLTVLWCNNTRVTNLSPLKGMPLKELRCNFVKERDAIILDGIVTLERINDMPAASFWTKAGPIIMKSGGRR